MALLLALPLVGIALLAAVLDSFKYLKALAWPVSFALVCIVGYWYYSAFRIGVLAVK